MKTLKYRSVFALATAIGLSVFLFTACEKESDGGSAPKQDRLEKFKRLRFSGESATTTTNSGSGTFIGNGSDISYTPPGGNQPNFAPASSDGVFTDPMSTGNSFAVSQSFGSGGGSLTLDGTSYDLDFGFCATTDITGSFSFSGNDTTSSDPDDLNAFIGVSGDFESFSSEGQGEGEMESGIDLFFYVFSFGGATEVGNFFAFEEGDTEGGVFIFAVEFNDDNESTMYFATEGSVNFSGSEVIIAGAKMAKVEEEGDLSSRLVDLQAQLECVQSPDEE